MISKLVNRVGTKQQRGTKKKRLNTILFFYMDKVQMSRVSEYNSPRLTRTHFGNNIVRVPV